MRVLHINLSPTALGRYGLLYGRGLAVTGGIEALSVFDRRLLEWPVMRELADEFEYRALTLAGTPRRWTGLARLVALAARYRPVVIHDTVGWSSPLGLLYWPLLARIAPLVITEHDPIPHIGMGRWRRSRWARSFIRRRAARIIVHGAGCRRTMIQHGVAPERILAEVHGHLGFFDRGAYADLEPEPGTILFFGALRPNKGVDWLLPIADRLKARHPDVRFLVAGSARVSRQLRAGPWADRLRAILEEMERRPEFELHEGFIPDDRVEYFFRRAGIVLLPYRDATQSGVAMIAMPFAKPIVATDVGDIAEVIRHERTGLLCEPEIDEIADAVSRLLDEPELGDRLGAAARELALTECSWEAIAGRMRAVYADAARIAPAP